MAAPHVAGAAALFVGKNGDVDNASFWITSRKTERDTMAGGDHLEVFLNIDDLIL